MSAARFCLTARDGRPVPRATSVPGGFPHCAGSTQRQWPPVITAHMGWPLLSTALDVIRGSCHPFRFSPPHLAARLAALLCVGRYFAHRCPSLMSHPELSNRAKRSASSLRPSYAKSLPAAPASEAGPQDFLAVIFLHERLISGVPLRSFPYPTDPAASSAPPRSSSPTTSSATSTTPSASHRCLLPVSAHAARDVPLPVRTSLPTSPPRLSCSGRLAEVQ
jgi:hypothetical protein